MQRSIKFRAWQIHRSDCAVYNEPAYPKGKCNCGARMLYDPFLEGLFVDFKDGIVQYDGCSDYSHEPSSLTWLPVNDRYVLMQYTGLKDKNGKEIYEGDIVRFRYNHQNKQGQVAYGTCGFCIIEWLDIPLRQVEIIGNIHENPELLEPCQ